MPTAELAARLNEIHGRVITGSRSASRDLFLEALRPVKAYLKKTYSGLRDDDIHDLATDSILAYLQEPRRFDPVLASLWTYLCMTASSDAIDLLRKRRRQQELLENANQDVELSASNANDSVEWERSIDAERIIKAHGNRLATNEPERRILALLLDGEKSTEAFAIARQSTWHGRVNQDGKGSRGIWIMPLMIVAGKRYVEG